MGWPLKADKGGWRRRGEGVTGRVWVKQGWSREGKGPQEIRRTGVRDTEGVV